AAVEPAAAAAPKGVPTPQAAPPPPAPTPQASGAPEAAAPSPESPVPAREPRAASPEPRATGTEDALRQRSSPLVRRIAKEHNVDISQIHGSGIGGRVTKDDILAFVGGGQRGQESRAGQVGRVGGETAAAAVT